MKKALTIMISLTVLVTIILTGCGSQPSNSSPAPSSGTASPQSQTPAEKQAMTAMFLGSTSEQAVVDLIQQVTDQYNANNAHNAEFKFETYENEQYKTKLATVMASNAAPDVFFTWSSGYLRPFVDGGKVYEIGQLLNKDQEWLNRFNDGVFGPVTYNGGIYAVPHGQTIAAVFYNTRLFDQIGVSVPKTYDDFITVCEKFKANNIIPITAPVQDAWIAGQLLQQLANGTGGIDLFNGTIDGSRKWNDEKYIEAGNLLKGLADMKAFQDGFLGMTNDEGRELFMQEKAAMYYMGSWEINILNGSDIAEYVDVFNIPAKDSATGNVALGDVDQCLAISNNAKNPAAAADYIKLYSDKAAQEAYAYNANYLLSTKTVLDESKLSPLFVSVNSLQQELTGVTPWLDRVFGAGEGVEFNNVAQAIMAGKDPQERFNELQEFAVSNADR